MNKMIDNIENMNKKTRMILSLVGVSAVVVPAILLLVVSRSAIREPDVAGGTRTVDSGNIEKTVKTTPSPVPTNTSAPKSASPSAKPAESSPSSR